MKGYTMYKINSPIINPDVIEIADVRVKINKILDDLYDEKINAYPKDFGELNRRDIFLTKNLIQKYGDNAGEIIWNACNMN